MHNPLWVPYLSKLLNCCQSLCRTLQRYRTPDQVPGTKIEKSSWSRVICHPSRIVLLRTCLNTTSRKYPFWIDSTVLQLCISTVVNPYAEHSVGTVLQGEYQVQKYRISLCQPSFVIRPESSSYAPTLIRLHGNHVLRLTDLRISSNEPCWNRRHIWVIPEKV